MWHEVCLRRIGESLQIVHADFLEPGKFHRGLVLLSKRCLTEIYENSKILYLGGGGLTHVSDVPSEFCRNSEISNVHNCNVIFETFVFGDTIFCSFFCFFVSI